MVAGGWTAGIAAIAAARASGGTSPVPACAASVATPRLLAAAVRALLTAVDAACRAAPAA